MPITRIRSLFRGKKPRSLPGGSSKGARVRYKQVRGQFDPRTLPKKYSEHLDTHNDAARFSTMTHERRLRLGSNYILSRTNPRTRNLLKDMKLISSKDGGEEELVKTYLRKRSMTPEELIRRLDKADGDVINAVNAIRKKAHNPQSIVALGRLPKGVVRRRVKEKLLEEDLRTATDDVFGNIGMDITNKLSLLQFFAEEHMEKPSP